MPNDAIQVLFKFLAPMYKIMAVFICKQDSLIELSSIRSQAHYYLQNCVRSYFYLGAF